MDEEMSRGKNGGDTSQKASLSWLLGPAIDNAELKSYSNAVQKADPVREGHWPMETTSYTEARGNLARLWDRAVHDREIIRITRRGTEDIAIIAADELESLIETAYLLRSPANAARLSAALRSALDRTEQPTTIDDLRQELGLAGESAEHSISRSEQPKAKSGRGFRARVPRGSRVARGKRTKTGHPDA
ncbi:MAG TPA: type II toxin-antitoxin system prevent-host-death family antitoxin [Chloroflexota bacterium]|nr:type II toxin-antitoxin system prevent-host-death family antitoxin [Chloroflexota bacterium]